jgi:hypothetical protein
VTASSIFSVWYSVSAAAAGLFRPHFRSKGHKSTAGEIEIGEREERKYLRTVLGDAAIGSRADAARLIVPQLLEGTRDELET